jgi:hypothetical protein
LFKQTLTILRVSLKFSQIMGSIKVNAAHMGGGQAQVMYGQDMYTFDFPMQASAVGNIQANKDFRVGNRNYSNHSNIY